MKHAAWMMVALAAGAGCAKSGGERPTSNVERRMLKEAVPSAREAIEAKEDVWGEAALRRPEGPTYEFFAPLLPPLRYVDARFRRYPIALSVPGGDVKARVVSDGSQINALARQPNWRNEMGTPVHIAVGMEREEFGRELARLDGPRFAEGYLPIVQMAYRHRDQVYKQEVFVSTDPALAEYGVVFAKFTLAEGESGKVEAQLEEGHDYYWGYPDQEDLAVANAAGVVTAAEKTGAKEQGAVRGPVPTTNPVAPTPGGEYFERVGAAAPVVMGFDKGWIWNKYQAATMAYLKRGESVTLVVFTKPAGGKVLARRVDEEMYRQQRETCAKTWNDVLARGMQASVPEAYVNNAWRSLMVGNYMMVTGDEMRYSAGTQYWRKYIGEGGDAIRTLAMYGQGADATRMMLAQFEFGRKGLEFHQAAFKLQMLAHVYALTHDATWLREHRELWEKELNIILSGREKATGMFPREKYCGDIDTRVYSLNSNANCWRAVRDMSVVLGEIGEREWAERLTPVVVEWRKVILAAIEKAKRHETDPPFLPVALSGEEEAHDPIDGTKMGGYWNLMINYILSSGVFRYDSQTADEVLRYLQTKQGLLMGMTRVSFGKSFWVGGPKLNDLYGMRYAELLLQRDEPDRALVSFYGKLAHGMTRDTFIDGEASSLGTVDGDGRQLYLPPNSAANASFLQQLRYLLVQDYDLNDDGHAETLRLLFATPRGWLEDGKEIRVERAPTAFGEVSVVAKSKLKDGRVDVELQLPEGHGLEKKYLRLRLPAGYKVVSAEAGGKQLPVAKGETIDLSGVSGRTILTAKVAR